MYTEQDKIQIRQRIVKYSVIYAVLLAATITVFVVGLKQGIQLVAQVGFFASYAVSCFMWLMFLYPSIRYLFFLRDMHAGLTREMAGSVVEVSGEEDLQDGVRVYPVRLQLADEDDERIVYLNVSKAEQFPAGGTKVQLSCFGRHIKEVTVV